MNLSARERHHYWQQHIDSYQSSGLSGLRYCQLHELTYHCFIYWRRKLTRQAPAGKQPDLSSSTGHLPSAFVAVQAEALPVVEAVALSDSLQLTLPNGLVIQNIADSNLGTVRSLLAHL